MGRAYSKDLRRRFATLLDSGQSASAAGRQLLVSRSTAVRWAGIWRSEQRCQALPMGGDRRSAAIEKHAETILSWVEEKPDIFLYEIVDKLGEKNFKASPDAVSNLLARHGVTRKKRRSWPANENVTILSKPAPSGTRT